MADNVSDAPIWETWETWDSVFLKTTTLGHAIIRRTLDDPTERITRIAVVPRGGLYMVNVLSRMLGLSGSEVLSLSLSRDDRAHPTEAGEFRIGSLPTRDAVAGQVVLLADEVHDTGETMQRAKEILLDLGETMQRAEEILLDLGALSVCMAAIHHKPGPNTTGTVPDFFVTETDGWVHYPWETIGPAGTLYREALGYKL